MDFRYDAGVLTPGGLGGKLENDARGLILKLISAKS
jgi:hypothetical protein